MIVCVLRYKKRNVFKIERDALLEDQKPELVPTNVVNTIALSPLEDIIMVTTRIPQLFSTILWGPDMTRLPEILLVRIMFQSEPNFSIFYSTSYGQCSHHLLFRHHCGFQFKFIFLKYYKGQGL